MTTYISSLIEPVVRHARRFSRSATEISQPETLTNQQKPSDTDSDVKHIALSPSPMQDAVDNEGSPVLQHATSGPEPSRESNGEESDTFSPMSISTPPVENDLRQLDQQRLRRIQERPLGSDSRDGQRARGGTDPLPRRPVDRAPANRRHTGLQVESHSFHSLHGLMQQTSIGSANGQFYMDDPRRSRSVSMSVDSGNFNSQPMSLDPSVSTSPANEDKRGLALPDDDGMRTVRDRIQAIQAMQVSVDEKSRLMHGVMNERWIESQHSGQNGPWKDESFAYPHSPAMASIRSQEAPTTPRSNLSIAEGHPMHSGDSFASPSTSLVTEPAEDELFASPKDLDPTFWERPNNEQSSSQTTTAQDFDEEQIDYGDDDLYGEQDEDVRNFGCAHYKRNVKLQCADCYRWYTCRFCHDAVESHSLVRHRTRNMLCMICGTPQLASKTCQKCHEDAAAYYCNICKLWDDDISKKIYHCSDCGICRLGEGLGKDFFHCPRCEVCISMSIRDTHKCIERSVDCDCPICGEYMFNSPTTVVFMRCGHGIHHTCYKRHLERNYRCPICAKSIINMEMSFRNLDRAIEGQPMPEQFRGTRAVIHCNDCRCKSSVPYHWLGLKCTECDSYNTAQLSISGSDETRDLVREGPENAPDSVLGLEPSSDNPSSRPATTQLRRPTSTGGLQDPRPPPGSEEFYPIDNRSRPVSALGPDRTRSEFASESRRPSQPTDDDDYEDELDFWGRDVSPRRSHTSASAAPAEGQGEEEEEEEEDSESSDDDLMDNEGDADDDDDDDDDGNVFNEIELLGHR